MLPLRRESPRPRAQRRAPDYPRALGLLMVAASFAAGCNTGSPRLGGDIAPAFDPADAETNKRYSVTPPASARPGTDPAPQPRLGGEAPAPIEPKPSPSR